MLYKNLPEEELKSVMRVRTLLDGIAALKFLLTFDTANFRAVWRARQEFARMRPDFEKDRAHNLALSVNGVRTFPSAMLDASYSITMPEAKNVSRSCK